MLIAFGVLVVAIAAVLIMAAARPDDFHVERSTVIAAPPAKIHPLIADFHRWTAWSPYEKYDAEMKRSYTGSPSGKGAVYEWQGNSKVGQGRMEVTDDPSSEVVIKLDFYKPWEAHNTARFAMTPEGAGTRVVWSMDGPSPFMAKVMGLFMNMDNLIGRDFEAGLANLKAAAEQ